MKNLSRDTCQLGLGCGGDGSGGAGGLFSFFSILVCQSLRIIYFGINKINVYEHKLADFKVGTEICLPIWDKQAVGSGTFSIIQAIVPTSPQWRFSCCGASEWVGWHNRTRQTNLDEWKPAIIVATTVAVASTHPVTACAAFAAAAAATKNEDSNIYCLDTTIAFRIRFCQILIKRNA